MNLSKGHKFIPSAVNFGFCIGRTVANVLRIAWAAKHRNVRLGIAAQIFVAAGVLLLFILNLVYAQRILRASHPRLGWSRPFAYFYKTIYTLLGLTLIIVIVATVQSLYTLDTNIRRIDRNLQLYGGSFTTFVAVLPLLIVAYVRFASRHDRLQPVDPFGKGSWSSKCLVLVVASALLTLGAGFRLGTNAMSPRPISNPAWYHHKACFYIFGFGLEAIVVYLSLFGRVDQRFYVPNGSSKVKSYARKEERRDDVSVSNGEMVQREEHLADTMEKGTAESAKMVEN